MGVATKLGHLAEKDGDYSLLNPARSGDEESLHDDKPAPKAYGTPSQRADLKHIRIAPRGVAVA